MNSMTCGYGWREIRIDPWWMVQTSISAPDTAGSWEQVSVSGQGHALLLLGDFRDKIQAMRDMLSDGGRCSSRDSDQHVIEMMAQKLVDRQLVFSRKIITHTVPPPNVSSVAPPRAAPASALRNKASNPAPRPSAKSAPESPPRVVEQQVGFVAQDAQAETLRNASWNGENNFASIYGRAPAAKTEIDGMADEIAGMFGGNVAKAPIKSQERALEKIMNDYAGDATRIKDLARNTIIVAPEKIDLVAAQLSSSGANVKVISGAVDPLGYSGVNSTIKTQAGIFGEIQVNSPAMIYAKEPEPLARALLGDSVYNSVAARSGVPGGLGHGFYEQWRVLSPNSSAATSIAQQSRAYYDAVRRANGH